MKAKRFMAFSLAVCMLVSSLLVGTGNQGVAYAYEKEQVMEELRLASSQNDYIIDKDEIVDKSDDRVMSQEDFATNDTETETPDAPVTGVVPGEDATPVDKQPSTENQGTANNAGEVGITGNATEQGATFEKVETPDVPMFNAPVENGLLTEATVSPEDIVPVIIVFDEKSIIDKNPEATMDFFTKIQVGLMELSQGYVIFKIEQFALDGEALDIDYQYTWLLNGISTKVPYGLIDDIKAISGVKDVLLQPTYEVCTADIVNPMTIVDGGMIGRDDAWASGFTGKGIKIAIVDTGIDEDHQNFQAMDESKLTADSATKTGIANVLAELNASVVYPGLTADDVYLSNKVVYAFNYVDNNLNINHKHDAQGDHGTHVAGISAANDLKNGEAVGVAPDAQLFVMKVFGRATSGAPADAILAAVEDAMILGVDVINMSLGSPAGFTSDGEAFDEIYEKIAETGVVMAVSAGNSGTAGQGNLWGTDQNLASNPDNSTIASPGTYMNVTTVASIENLAYKDFYVEVAGKKNGYIEASNGENESIMTIAGQEYGLAYVPNCGQTAEDFAGVDCEGKIVLVQRGVTAFSEKVQLAEDAGAIACIIYNNEPGAIRMDMTGGTAIIPSVSISISAGEEMLAALEADPNVKISFSTEEGIVPSVDAGNMSIFSSWGVSPDLKLEPDITAPGGNIYSTLDDGQYGLMSGTSMASPNLAGLAALVKQYVKTQYPNLTAPEARTLINALLMSTATPVMNNGVPYSPRLQGAGLANAYAAINSGAYISVNGMDLPKVELLDDPSKTGSYSYKFNVNNIGTTTIYYHLDTNLQTEGVDDLGILFMNSVPVKLDGSTTETSNGFVLTYDYNNDKVANILDAYALYEGVVENKTVAGEEFFRYNLDADEDKDVADVQAYLDALVGKEGAADLEDEVLKVAAGEKAEVSVQVAVSETGKAYMDEYFENGIYVEGFTYLTAESAGDIDLSIPYMGFYGDWTKAPILDAGYYWEDEMNTWASQYAHVLFTQYGPEDLWYPGLNPYFGYAEPFDPSNISFSPNGDGYADYIKDMYVSLLRNAETLSFTYTLEDGTVLFEEIIEHARKTVFNDSYMQIVPYVYGWYSYPYPLMDELGQVLPDGTKVTLSVKADLAYNAHEENNLYNEWKVPFTVDLSAPVLEDVKIYVDEEAGKQYALLKFQDNVATAAVNFLNMRGTTVFAQYPVDHAIEKAGEEYVAYDITGYGNEFMVVLGDYAFNEEAYIVETENNDPILDKTKLYGYRVYDQLIQDDRLYGWLSIDKTTAAATAHSSEYYMDFSLVAAEYVGGYILAVDANKDLVFIKPGYWDERTKIATIGSTIRDMAFDPTTETLYALHKDNEQLISIDIETGEITFIGYDYDLYGARTLTCDDAGQLYGINSSGALKKIDKEEGCFVGSTIVDTRAITKGSLSYAQSMTYDSEADCIYWASYTSSNGVLYKITLGETPAMTPVGTIAGNAEVVGLLCLDDKGFELPKDVVLSQIDIKQDAVTLLEGEKAILDLALTPWYGAKGDTVWSVADTSVAIVDERGNVAAVGVGTTTVTVQVAVGEDILSATSTVKVIAPAAEIDGFVMASDNLYNQWVEFNSATFTGTVGEPGFVSFYAGEQVDGIYYAYSANGAFYHIDAETKEATQITNPRMDISIVDMAFDYSTGIMYGLAQDLTVGTIYLAEIDMKTGAIYLVGELWDDYSNPVCGLAISTTGTKYVLGYSGFLYTVDGVDEDDVCELTSLGFVGYEGSMMLQSMAYDHNQNGEDTNEGIYWSMLGSDMGIMYIDLQTVTALKLGTLDGGEQVTALSVVPENEDELLAALPEVEVESVDMLNDSMTILAGSTTIIPVEVLPLNATNRDLVWTVEDGTIVSVADGMITGLVAGTTTVTGTLGDHEVSFSVEVLPAAGEIHAYILTDMATYNGYFWGKFNDADLSAGEALTDMTPYELHAAEYYNGKIYGYAMDMETYESIFVVLDAETFEVEESMTGEFPDMLDMAFDYSTGVMYGIGGAKNSSGNNILWAIDLTTGNAYEMVQLDNQYFGLACSTEGTLYAINAEGILVTLDPVAGTITEIGETGHYANSYQSMAYDHNTGNLYWAQVYSDFLMGVQELKLFIVNTEDASVLELGMIGTAGCQVVGMHTIPNEETAAGLVVPEQDITGVVMKKDSQFMKPGETFAITAVAAPISVTTSDAVLTYTSEDTSVATVDANGVVTAVAVGTTNIIVTAADGVTATCKISVVDANTQLQVFTKTGWQKSPLLEPNTIVEDSTVTVEVEGFSIWAVEEKDGFFYGICEKGYLWKFNEDLSVCEKVTNGEAEAVTIKSTFEDCDGETVVANATTDIMKDSEGNLYVLGRVIATVIDEVFGEEEVYLFNIYALDETTGTTTFVAEIPLPIQNPAKVEFVANDAIIIYDSFNDYIYSGVIEDGVCTVEQLVWAQNVLGANDYIGMTYSEEYDVVFMATKDIYINYGKMGLYVIDYKAKTIERYGEAKYDKNLRDILIVEATISE